MSLLCNTFLIAVFSRWNCCIALYHESLVKYTYLKKIETAAKKEELCSFVQLLSITRGQNVDFEVEIPFLFGILALEPAFLVFRNSFG